MAVGLRITFSDGTQQQYDAVNERMGIEAQPPEGLIFHVAGPLEGGWVIADVWESRAHFDRFSEDRLGPALAALGDQGPAGPPDIQEFEVYNYLKP